MNKYRKIFLIVGCVLILGKQDLFPQRKSVYRQEYVSKWERVLDLGRAIKEGSVKERMQVKDQILDILLKEDLNYPRVYVDQNASGSGDGSSWHDAFNDIQPAIDYLENNEEEGWIWVASGIYNPIIIASGIMVFGGFSGMESKLDERNYLEHETIIRNKNGPGPQGPSGVTMNHKTLIDGFTIRNCGFYNTPKHQLADNFVGGGIRTWSWFSIIRNNHIYNNKAASGSGIAAWGRHDYQRMEEYTPIIERNIIHHNSATCGAVVIHTSEVLFAHNIVCFNYCDILPNKSKGVEVDFNPNICDKPIVVNSILWGNTKRKFFTDLYNHTSKVEQYGDAAKAISLYNCIQHKGYGEGLVKDDPLFVDPDNYNFLVKANSPCINAGYPDAPLDADHTRSDIGIFILQYCLTIIDSSRIDPVSGQSFFPGSVVPISADSLVQDSTQTTQYLFHSWIGIGTGSYTGSVRDTSVCMDTSITEIINWDKNFRLEVSTGTDLDSCSGWYGEGREITLTLPSIIQIEEGVRKYFLGWQGKGEKIISDQDTSITLAMNTPVELSAVWQKEYLLTLDSEYDGSYTGASPDTMVVMSNPITETADWKTQFFVEIESEYGNPQGEKWYDDKSMVHLSLDTVDSISPEVRARFIRWSGNGYSGSDPDPLFQITEPLYQRAEWQKEYWVDIMVDPVQGGEVKPFGEPGAWQEANQTICFSVIENIKDGYGFYSWSGTKRRFKPCWLAPIYSARKAMLKDCWRCSKQS
ncbi:MAG: right-handed parallel beta-helix repeat-containing protein, partial [bacterium]